MDADELYYHFAYLSLRNSRKDTLGLMHSALLEELQKCLQPFDLHAKTSTLPLPRRKEAEYFAKLISDTSHIIVTHRHMMGLYRLLSNPTQTINYVELIKFLEKVERQVHTHITHPVLENIKININTELFILHKLFLAEAQMTMNHQFRETLFNVYQSRADLHTWKSRMDREYGSQANNSSGSSMLSFASNRNSNLSYLKIPLYIWLNEFVNTLLGKMTLFFYKPLWRQERLTGTPDMKALAMRMESAYPNTIEQFCFKTDCTFFCLVLEAEGLESYSPDGYICPEENSEAEPLTGMKLYPIIFSVPYLDDTPLPGTSGAGSSTNNPLTLSSSSSSSSSSQIQASGPIPNPDSRLQAEHLPSIVVLLQDNIDELNAWKPRPLCVTYAGSRESKDDATTYYLFKVSPKVTAAIVYKRKVKADDSTDSAVLDLKNYLSSHLRNHRIFSKLVPKE